MEELFLEPELRPMVFTIVVILTMVLGIICSHMIEYLYLQEESSEFEINRCIQGKSKLRKKRKLVTRNSILRRKRLFRDIKVKYVKNYIKGKSSQGTITALNTKKSATKSDLNQKSRLFAEHASIVSKEPYSPKCRKCLFGTFNACEDNYTVSPLFEDTADMKFAKPLGHLKLKKD